MIKNLCLKILSEMPVSFFSTNGFVEKTLTGKDKKVKGEAHAIFKTLEYEDKIKTIHVFKYSIITHSVWCLESNKKNMILQNIIVLFKITNQNQ